LLERRFQCLPARAIKITNGGDGSTTFLVLQGIGEYDYVPLAS
jgi:hypothetical protein